MRSHPPLQRNSLLISLIAIMLILSGCQQQVHEITAAAPGKPSPASGQANDNPVNTITADDTEEEATQDNTETPEAPTPTPTFAPTLADWRDAPIMPEISDRVAEIYAEGQRQGRDPASFSVIGDCQSIPYVFMGPFGRGAQEPGAGDGYLWDAINYFNDSLKRWAVTARGGFTAASILNALQADTEQCKPGETPLTCEFRLNNPAYVLITLETWLDPETIDRYEVYLRQILDTVIEKGAVPILLTKADASELRGERHVINPVIVNLAYQYQVPVVNFWKAAQYLDNYGIDRNREGFHLSPAGYDLKNTLALRALYEVWASLEGEGIDSAAEPDVPTPTPTATETIPDPKITSPTCGEAGCVFFGTAQSEDGSVAAQGVYAYDVSGGALSQVLPAGFNLQDGSEDGGRLLVNFENFLWTVDLADGQVDLVSETFAYFGQQAAYFNADGDVVYLDEADPIQTDVGTAITLQKSPQTDTLYFDAGGCSEMHYCQSEGAFSMSAEGDITALSEYQHPVFSPDGAWVAFLNPEAATRLNYYHISYLLAERVGQGAASRRTLYPPAESGFEVYPDVADFSFSPDGDQVYLLYDVYSEYYEKSLRLQAYLWDLNSGTLFDFGNLEGPAASLNPRYAWSPDGDQILLFATDMTDDGEYRTSVYQTNMDTGDKMILLDEAIFSETDYFYLTNVYWQ
ncbi:MAG: hypothetical protein SVR81_00605 [Chloroflexota bacterium]|nr:hypothetical protein [Chloroflexota bacterium]